MTPHPGSLATAPLSTPLPHTTDELSVSDEFADRHWTSAATEDNSVWSAASYWVRRKRAAQLADLTS